MRRATVIVGLLLLVVVVVVAGLGWYNEARPVPRLTPRAHEAATVTLGEAPTFTWPSGTEDAIGVAGVGVLAQTPAQAPQPTGSVAKVMTALVALQELPLQVGDQGPTIAITPADQEVQEEDAASGQSTVPVTAGETLTEYQVLQGMLLPSGNNLATLLASWAFGSIPAAVAAMTAEAKTLGLQSSTFTDPSGFDPTTVSTPADLVKLGAAAMQNPVIAQIVGQSEATLPGSGLVKNVDSVLGQAGIVGIKTGNTTGQNGAFLFASEGPSAPGAMVIGAVMGAASLRGALQGAVALAGQAATALVVRTVVGAGAVVAGVRAPWDEGVAIATQRPLAIVAWGGQQATLSIRLHPLRAPVAKGADVGTLTASLGDRTVTTPLVTVAALHAPSRKWRLLRRPSRVWPLT